MKTWLLGVLAKRYLKFTNISSAVEKKVHHLKKSIPFLIPKTPSLSFLLLLLLWTVNKSTEDVDDELKQSWEVLKISLNATSIEALYFVSKKKIPIFFHINTIVFIIIIIIIIIFIVVMIFIAIIIISTIITISMIIKVFLICLNS